MPQLRCDRRRNEVIIARIEQDQCRADLGSGRLVKLHPNKDNFTELQNHPSIARKQHLLASKLFQTVGGPQSAMPNRNSTAPT
ncbi:MAG TPA: hypothetical protein VGK64_29875 [Bryobacteraceae bacterium]